MFASFLSTFHYLQPFNHQKAMVSKNNDPNNPQSYSPPRVIPPSERPGFRVKRENITREQRFIEFIMGGMDQVTAYRKAGYKASTDKAAKIAASKVLKRPRVVQMMKDIGQAVVDDIAATTKKVVDELAKVAFSDIRDYVDIGAKKLKMVLDDGEEVWEEVIELKVKPLDKMKNTSAIARVKQGRYGMEVSLWDKVKALELMGKYLDMFGGEDNRPEELEVDLSQLTNEELALYYKITQKITA